MLQFSSLTTPSLPPLGVVIHTTDAEADAATSSAVCDDEKLKMVQKAVPPVSSLKDLTLKPLDFEKVCLLYMHKCVCVCGCICNVMSYFL